MKKFLQVLICLVMVAAVVLCIVFLNQKNDLSKKLETVTAEVNEIQAKADKAEEDKAALEKENAELKKAKADLEDNLQVVTEDKNKFEASYNELYQYLAPLAPFFQMMENNPEMLNEMLTVEGVNPEEVGQITEAVENAEASKTTEQEAPAGNN